VNLNTILTGRAGFTSSQLPTHAVFALRGDIDRTTAPALRERLLIALHHTETPVIIDLSRVSSCDNSGLALLVGARRRARLHGIPTSLAAPQPRVSDLLRVTGLHRAFTIHPTLAAAQLNCGRPGRLWRKRRPRIHD
jgi:anti-anti-sigma factor